MFDDVEGQDGERPRDPAIAAAHVMLIRAAAALGGAPADLAQNGTVCILLLPDAHWAEPFEDAWRALACNGEMPTSPHRQFSSPGRGWSVWRALAGDRTARSREGERFAIAASLGQHCVGLTADPALLPADLRAATDHQLEPGLLTPADISGLTQALGAGEASFMLDDAEAAALSPRLLRLARRPGQAADAYLRKLREILSREAPPAPAMTSTSPRSAPTLDRLHGMDEAVAWGRSLARDLAAYRAGELPWSAVDRGVLLSGPPGTGKTTFSRALASSCKVKLIAGSYAAWLGTGTGHQGDLLRGMRNTFAEARSAAPAILFLDEVDSFPNRATVTHARSEWDVQMVNALLGEVDGLEGREGVVLVAACNLPQILDPALTRSGRLDRHIRIEPPDTAALAAILREHLGEDLPGTDLSRLALVAAGSTGADVERMVRGARRRARETRRAMTADDLGAELGAEVARDPLARRLAVIHEAGHAVAIALRRPGGLRAVTLSGRGGSVDSATVANLRPAELAGLLVELLAGRAAEEVVLGAPSADAGGSAESDLAKATALATAAAAALGFDAELGLVWRGLAEPSRVPAMLRDHPSLAIRVREMLDKAYRDAVNLMCDHRSAIETLAAALLAHGALQGAEAEAMIASALEEART